MNLDPKYLGETMKGLESLLKLDNLTYQQRAAVYASMLLVDIELNRKLRE